MSPWLLAGAFRPAERALAYVAARRWWAVDRSRAATTTMQPYDDALGSGRRLDAHGSHCPARRHAAPRDCPVRQRIRTASRASASRTRAPRRCRLTVLHAFVTPSTGRGRLQLGAASGDWRIYRNGWQSWSPTMSFGGAQQDCRSAPPVLCAARSTARAGAFRVRRRRRHIRAGFGTFIARRRGHGAGPHDAGIHRRAGAPPGRSLPGRRHGRRAR